MRRQRNLLGMAEHRDNGFPDQHLVNHVREALWRRPGGASVMVGSGFSRNATSVRPDAAPIPLWSDLAAELAASLPDSGELGGVGAEEQEKPPGADALELAQKYEDAFGRARLHELLSKSVRDEDFRPGDLHRRLLALPWRDVFTTNWDTLLERCLPLPERAYGVVTSADHLPLRAPPRIVKLHGSLPGTFPLIVTKRDYEDYEDRFAPFVNTVQQSMMETVVLLLGFSGNDPNFRQWLSWVRANLRDNMPRIYLANLLGLDDQGRAKLREKNVVPIDLAKHPRAQDWPEPLIYAKAAEWLLLSLEHGQPYPAEDWPQPVATHLRSVPEGLEPVDSVRVSGPQGEPRNRPNGEPDDPEYLAAIRDVLSVWRRNRRCYPAWLVMPSERAAAFMRYTTEDWEPLILKALPHFGDGLERLSALRELVWRREIQLDPLSELPKLVDKAVEVLDEVDCEQRLVGGRPGSNVEWERLRCQWRALATALLTAARHALDSEKFEHWIGRLAPFIDEDAELAERVRHERCLWSLNHHDFEQLEAHVDEWQPQAADPIWFLRKAALLVELGRGKEARDLALGVLEIVRKWPSDAASFAAPSREAWALSLVAATYGYRGDVAARHRELQSRFRELAAYRCDPRTEFSGHERAVSLQGQDNEYKPFDLGVRNVKGLGFSKVAGLRALAAFRAIRFTEIVGSPSIVSGDLLVRAAEALLPYRPRWSSVLSVGFSHKNAEGRFSKTLSRWRIACMAPDLASSFAEAQHGTIRLALDRLDRKDEESEGWWIWLHRLEAAVEALSRFVLRLELAGVERALALALSLYSDTRIHSRIGLLGAHRHLLSRSWEALPDALRAEQALALISMPIIGVDDFTVDTPDHLVDPGQVLDSDRRRCPVPERSDDNETLWTEAVRLVDAGLRAGSQARKRAALRLAVLGEWKVLTAGEEDRLAAALWDFGVDEDRLPADTNLQPWVFLRLPEPEPGLAEQRVRATWVPSGGGDDGEAAPGEEALASAGVAQEGLPDSGQPIEFTSAERAALVRGIERWAESRPRGHVPWLGSPDARTQRRRIRAISALLLGLDVSREATALLIDRVREMATGKTPAYELLPGIVGSDPGLADDAAALLRVGLGGGAAEQKAQCASAGRGLYLWLRASASAEVPPPPAHLIFELGAIISAHRWLALSNALEVAAWVFENGTDEHRELLRLPCLEGLAFLRTVLAFREDPNPHPFMEQPQVVSEDEVDVPWLRLHCVGLAAAMDRAGLSEETAIAEWLADAESDPLPELRNHKGLARSPD